MKTSDILILIMFNCMLSLPAIPVLVVLFYNFNQVFTIILAGSLFYLLFRFNVDVINYLKQQEKDR